LAAIADFEYDWYWVRITKLFIQWLLFRIARFLFSYLDSATPKIEL